MILENDLDFRLSHSPTAYHYGGFIMDEYDAWNEFLKTGSVLDYLAYSSMKNSKQYFDDSEPLEDAYESEHRRSDYQGTEYW